MESYFVPHIQRIKLRRELFGLLLLNNIDSRLLPIAEHEVSAKMSIPSFWEALKKPKRPTNRFLCLCMVFCELVSHAVKYLTNDRTFDGSSLNGSHTLR